MTCAQAREYPAQNSVVAHSLGRAWSHGLLRRLDLPTMNRAVAAGPHGEQKRSHRGGQQVPLERLGAAVPGMCMPHVVLRLDLRTPCHFPIGKRPEFSLHSMLPGIRKASRPIGKVFATIVSMFCDRPFPAKTRIPERAAQAFRRTRRACWRRLAWRPLCPAAHPAVGVFVVTRPTAGSSSLPSTR